MDIVYISKFSQLNYQVTANLHDVPTAMYELCDGRGVLDYSCY